MNKIDTKALDFCYLLEEYYKEFNISDEEFLVILLSYHLLLNDPRLITPEILELKLNLSKAKIDKAMKSLYKKGFLTYKKVNNSLITSFDELFKKLAERFYKEFSKNIEGEEEADDTALEVFTIFEEQLNRNLDVNEIQIIENWLNNNVDKEIIINSLKDAINNNETSLVSVEKRLQKRLKEKANEEIY